MESSLQRRRRRCAIPIADVGRSPGPLARTPFTTSVIHPEQAHPAARQGPHLERQQVDRFGLATLVDGTGSRSPI